MAIDKKLIYIKTESRFNTLLNNNEIDEKSIVFIEDSKRIWTHGNFFDGDWGGLNNKPTTLSGYGITDAAKKINSLYYVEGNTTGTAGTWTGSIPEVTSLYAGLTIAYKIGVAGASTTNLNLNGLGNKLVRRNTSNLTTHLPVGTVVLLTYDGTRWVWADYHANTTYAAMSVDEGKAGTAGTLRTMRADYLKQIVEHHIANTVPSAHTLGSHSDVTLASLANGNILRYNGSRWVNNTLAQAGIATPADITTAINNLEIGGRNYWAITKSPQHSYIKYFPETNTFKNTTASGSFAVFRLDKLEIDINSFYALSFEIRVLYGNPQFSNNVLYVNGASPSTTHNRPTLILDEYVKVYGTFNYTAESTGLVHIYFNSGLTGINQIEFRNFQVEKGTKATDWTPAPEDQVSDWLTTDVNSFSFIKNKPSTFTPSAHTHTFASLTSKPTTLSGYGITDAYTKTQVDTSLNSKFDKTGGRLTTGTGDVNVELWRGTNASWDIINTAGYLKFRSNYTTTAGAYFDVLTLDYNTGHAKLKGNFTAPTFIGALTGNASSATYASAVTLTADNTTNATRYPLFVDAATGNKSPRTDTGFTYNPSTGALTATSFLGKATSAGDADTVGGLAVNPVANTSANRLVRTNASGYIQASYINTTSGTASGTLNRVYVSQDSYLRYLTPSSFISNLGLATTSYVDNIEIGGRNLITDRHSIIFNGADYPTHTSTVNELNSNGERENTVTSILGEGRNRAYRYAFIQSKFSAFPQAKKHVYSFDYKTNHIGGAITIDIRSPVISAYFYAPNTNETWRRGYIVADWTGKTTQSQSLLSLRPSDSSTGNYVSIRNLKLVEGEKGWDDSPAPEDQVTISTTQTITGTKTFTQAINGSLSGNASTATALTTSAGSATQPVYFSGGKPVATTYSLGKSVPSNAVFTDTNTHYTTRLYAGASGTATNTVLSNPYIKVTDDNSYSNQIQLYGGSNVTIASDVNGRITINSSYTDTNTWKANSSTSEGYVAKGVANMVWKTDGSGNPAWRVDANTTYSNFTKTVAGLVPAPTGSTSTRFLREDGQWHIPSSTEYTAGTGISLNNKTFNLNTATASALGGVKLFDDTIQSGTSKVYGVQLNSSGQMVVNVPWTDTNTNTTYSAGTGLSLSGTTFNVNYGTTSGTVAQGNDSRITNGDTAYGWGNHASAGYLTSIPLASTTVIGGGYLVNNTKANVTLSRTTTANRYYPVQLNTSNQMMVNVPWTDTTSSYTLPTASASTLGGIKVGTNLSINSSTGVLSATDTKYSAGSNISINGSNVISATNTTYNVFTRTIDGLVPKSEGSTTTRYLREDGTWVIPPNTGDTHWTTGIRAGASETITNATVSNPYIKVIDDSTYRDQIRLIGGGATTVKSDASGNVTISSPNKTYTTGTLLQLFQGTNDIGMLQSAKNLNKWLGDKFQVVTSLPTSPTAGVFYFIKE